MSAPKPVIVYVEDNSGDALLLREALVDEGCDVELLVIDRGDKAMHYFEVKARARDLPPPHCILLDAHLPMVTGLQLVTFIRGEEAFKETPVFLFASAHDYAEVSASVNISPESFLAKPSDWQHFRALAAMLMRGARHAEESPTTRPEAAAAPDPALLVHPAAERR